MSVKNVKVANIRPKYNNLKEWIDDKENNIYIGRAGIVFIDNERFPKQASIFCNPYKVGKDGTREEVIDKYKIYIIRKIENSTELKTQLISMKGKNLGCWCCPELCHGDVLLKLIEIYS
jgi:hypothetical protein